MEKKVQALGGKKDFFVCSCCAQDEYNKVFDFVRSIFLPAIPSMILLLAGLGLTLYFWNTAFVPFKMLGLAAIICEITVLYSNIQKNMRQKAELNSVDKVKAVKKAGDLMIL